MNWDAVGAVAELVGALAVVTTLIYLARQIGTAREELKTHTSLVINERLSKLSSIAVENPTFATALSKLEAQETEITPTERIQIRAYANFCLGSWAEWYKQSQKFPETRDESIKLIQAAIQDFLSTPQSIAHWQAVRHRYNDAFASLVDSIADASKEPGT